MTFKEELSDALNFEYVSLAVRKNATVRAKPVVVVNVFRGEHMNSFAFDKNADTSVAHIAGVINEYMARQ